MLATTMMRRFWDYLTEPRQRMFCAVAAGLAICFLGAELLELALFWPLLAALLLLLAMVAIWLWRRRRAARATAQLASVIGAVSTTATDTEAPLDPTAAEVQLLRAALMKAIATIRRSRLGAVAGQRALYELPWYMVIGNPAAGKSSAIANSGLQFPYADGKVLQGVGGTRQCDWFFTPEGILLDTAGRYAAQDAHRPEWYGFLDLLRKHRQRAPINGILMAVSIAELRAADPAAAIALARSLRQRVQDLIERLQVFAPVYLLFTKADLIAGFGEFFASAERSERERVWGATMPYQRKVASQQIMAFFEQSFDELCAGLKELSVASMSQQGRAALAPGIFTFPQEFATLRTPLRAFLATLFEENPYQFKPVFRGYYFSSALQEGRCESAQTPRLAQRFGLTPSAHVPSQPGGQAGFFLLQLFRQVIFADKALVTHYASRRRVRLTYAAFFGAALLLGGAMAGWSWSSMANRQLVLHVQADLDKVIHLQEQRLDLPARLEALEVLQDRLEQLQGYRHARPWHLRFGLYQGDRLEAKLRSEYFAGMRQVMLAPVVANLEALLTELNAHPEPLQLGRAAPLAAAGQPFQQASATNPEDAYNALKSYLMLADPVHAEAGHLNDQLPRYWRSWLESNRGDMTREQLIRTAARLMTFYLSQLGESDWPRMELKLALVEQAREHLRQVVRGMPARERVYGEIRARANTRFAALSVARVVGEADQALLSGSQVVNGAYTREAWEQYIEPALKAVATHELQSSDWVLQSVARDDLTLEGSPEQIQQGLLALYKADYVRAWQTFVQGVTITPLQSFDAAVTAMNRLGDPVTSPILKLFSVIAQQTSWDQPVARDAERAPVHQGLRHWFSRVVLRRDSVPLAVEVARPPAPGPLAMGAVAREFSAFSHLAGGNQQAASLLRAYLEGLARVRARLNALKNQGDPGPGARSLMQQTLEGTGSELADTLRLIDEQMLNGMSDTHKQVLRPLLVRPLMQTFAVLLGPVEAELNKTWLAQVVEPFRQTLAGKYPFDMQARTEASESEIGRIFGPEGAIAKFSSSALGALVIRRGDMLASRTWAEMGIRLSPTMAARIAAWMAPAGSLAAAGPPAVAQTLFQLQPMPAQGVMEYTIDIDGQQLRYRNTAPQWASMVHPAALGESGARLTAVSLDGRQIVVFSEAGPSGLKSLIDSASKQKREDGVFELHWQAGAISIPVALKIISHGQPPAATGGAHGLRGLQLPEMIVGALP